MDLGGALTRRGDEPLDGYCPIERAMRSISTRSSLLLLREAFYGATRFEQFTTRTELSTATTAANLRQLVDAGILARRTYREPGRRARDEYVLTDAGNDLFPVVFGYLQWANRHDPPPYPPRMRHEGCGRGVRIVVECTAGHRVRPEEIRVSAPGPFGLDDPVTIDEWDERQA